MKKFILFLLVGVVVVSTAAFVFAADAQMDTTDPVPPATPQFIDEDGDGVCDVCGNVPQGPGNGAQGGRWTDGDAAVPGQNFVDEDGDGVCDLCGGTPQGPMGRQYGRFGQNGEPGHGLNFVDEDGDGICNNCAGGQGNFIDENGDGICDLQGTGGQQMRRGMGQGRGYGRMGQGGQGLNQNQQP